MFASLKRMILLLSLLVVCNLTFSQISKQRFDACMRDVALMMNEVAPIPLDHDLGFLEVFSYKNDVLTIDVVTNEGKIDYSQLLSNESFTHKVYAVAVRYMLEGVWKVLLEDVDRSAYDTLFDYLDAVRMVFVEENTHRGCTLDISSAELKAAKQEKINTDKDLDLKESMTQIMQDDAQDEALRSQFEEFSKVNCPLEVSDGIFINEISYGDKFLKYVFELPINYADMDSVAMKEGVVDRIIHPSSGSTKELVDYVIELGAGISFEIHYQDKTVEWRIPAEELAELNKNGTVADEQAIRERLQQSCREINAQTPVQLDEITSLDSAMIEGANYVYCYTITADFLVDFDSKETIDGIHTSNQLSLYAADLLLVNFMEELVAADMNLVFRYNNAANGKVISDVFSKKDLEEIIEAKKSE